MKIRVDLYGTQEDDEIAFVYENIGGDEEGLFYNGPNESVDIRMKDSYDDFIIVKQDWNNFVKAVNMMDSKLKELGKMD